MRHRIVFLSASLLVVLGVIGCSGGSPSSKTAREILDGADEIELYSLNPAHKDEDSKGFHGWAVLGKVRIQQPETRKRIVEALYKSLADSDGVRVKCFDPRHGIRATFQNKTIDIVICFECIQAEFKMSGKSKTEGLTRTAEPVFDEVLTKAYVPLAKKSH